MSPPPVITTKSTTKIPDSMKGKITSLSDRRVSLSTISERERERERNVNKKTKANLDYVANQGLFCYVCWCTEASLIEEE